MRLQQKAFYADLFFKTTPSVLTSKPTLKTTPSAAPVSAKSSEDDAKNAGPGPSKDNALISQSRDLVPLNDAASKNHTDTVSLSGPAPDRSSMLRDVIGNADAHNLSPREMTNFSQCLYAAGVISFEEYSLLAFQPELHPDFGRTIGALTDETAAPDQRRDFVSIWRERADFQRRHNADRPDLIAQSEHIAQVLGHIEAPTNVVV